MRKFRRHRPSVAACQHPQRDRDLETSKRGECARHRGCRFGCLSDSSRRLYTALSMVLLSMTRP